MRFYLLLFALFTFSFLAAQSTVKGTVVTPSGESAMFATVAITDPETEEIITAVNTDLAGSFEVETKVDRFVVAVTYVGFKPERIDQLNPQGGIIDLGEIELKADAEVLDEVVVVAEKSSTEFKLDKRVFNPGKDLNARGQPRQEPVKGRQGFVRMGGV